MESTLQGSQSVIPDDSCSQFLAFLPGLTCTSRPPSWGAQFSVWSLVTFGIAWVNWIVGFSTTWEARDGNRMHPAEVNQFKMFSLPLSSGGKEPYALPYRIRIWLLRCMLMAYSYLLNAWTLNFKLFSIWNRPRYRLLAAEQISMSWCLSLGGFPTALSTALRRFSWTQHCWRLHIRVNNARNLPNTDSGVWISGCHGIQDTHWDDTLVPMHHGHLLYIPLDVQVMGDVFHPQMLWKVVRVEQFIEYVLILVELQGELSYC